MTTTRFEKARRRMLITLAGASLAGTALATAGPPALHVHAATASSLGYAVSEAIDSTSGNTYIAAQGPAHSLFFYWNLKGTWYGPLQVGAHGSTFSGPSLSIDHNGNVVIAVQGPSNSLWFYWNVSGKWYGPLQIGAPGTAMSTPSIGLDQDFNLDVAVQGRNQTTAFLWGISGTWHGPVTLGSAGMSLSAPSLSAGTDTTTHRVYIATRGPNNSLLVFENSSGTWAKPAMSNPQTTFAAPSNSQGIFYVQGAGNDMDNWEWNIDTSTNTPYVFGEWPIAPGGSTLSAAAGDGLASATAIGPSNSLFFYWEAGGWRGPLGLGGAGSSFSVPAIASMAADSSNPAIAVEGPNNSLFFYWNIKGTWYGPVGVGGPGTTFSSAT